jgi:hypothetical protein
MINALFVWLISYQYFSLRTNLWTMKNSAGFESSDEQSDVSSRPDCWLRMVRLEQLNVLSPSSVLNE